MSTAITVQPLSPQDEVILDGFRSAPNLYFLQVSAAMSPELVAQLHQVMDDLGIVHTFAAVEVLASPQAPLPDTL